MIAASRDRVTPSGDRLTYVCADLRSWLPPAAPDVVVANAVLQWVPGHLDLIDAIAGWLAPGGAFAFQVPGNFDSPSHTVIRELRESPQWRDRLGEGADRQPAVEDLRPTSRATRRRRARARMCGRRRTCIVLSGEDPVLEWVKGTALRPVLTALDGDDVATAEFLAECRPASRGLPAGSDGDGVPVPADLRRRHVRGRPHEDADCLAALSRGGRGVPALAPAAAGRRTVDGGRSAEPDKRCRDRRRQRLRVEQSRRSRTRAAAARLAFVGPIGAHRQKGALTAGHCVATLAGGPAYHVHQTESLSADGTAPGDLLGKVTASQLPRRRSDGDSAFVGLARGRGARPLGVHRRLAHTRHDPGRRRQGPRDRHAGLLLGRGDRRALRLHHRRRLADRVLQVGRRPASTIGNEWRATGEAAPRARVTRARRSTSTTAASPMRSASCPAGR